MSDPILNYRFVIFLPNFIISFTAFLIDLTINILTIAIIYEI
jgi:hypothetical protein